MTRLAWRPNRHCFVFAAALIVAACGTAPKKPADTRPPVQPTRPGGYYLDDGPGDNPPANLLNIPDAVPLDEPLHRAANRPYTVFGKTYVPNVGNDAFRQTGIASWYGRKFHGQKTSNGDTYDMYAMTAAHPTLPIPSYARVTHPASGKSVVVRINDRGPFHGDRIIDLSYAAAAKLGIAAPGSGQVIVERLFASNYVAMAVAATGPRAITPAPSQVQVPALATSSESGGVFIQLGAFSSPENAEAFRERMQRELGWMREPIATVYKDNLHRVRIGPLANREEASAIAEKVRATMNIFPLVTQP